MRNLPKNPKNNSVDQFWSKFAKDFWEKKPGVFRKTRLPILEIDADHIFELLVQYSNQCRKTQIVTGFKLYIDGQRQFDSEVLDCLPSKKDRSLQGYHTRMSQQYTDYCLVCDELLQGTREKWDVLSVFVQGLYKHVGMPTRFAEIGLYLGNYRRTPFGVHIDGCGVFSIPVLGKKKFRLWTTEYVKKHPHLVEAHTYREFKPGSSTLIVQPDDISYWPSAYWHIAESDGSFNATWSIGVWVDEPFSETFTRNLKPLIVSKLGKIGDARAIDVVARQLGEVTKLPVILQRSIEVLHGLTEAELRDTMLKYWLDHSSKQGFKNGPAPRVYARLNPDTSALISWARLSNGQVCVAANGIVTEIPGTDQAVLVLQDLNSGASFSVSQLLKKIPQKALQLLFEAGALERKEESGP